MFGSVAAGQTLLADRAHDSDALHEAPASRCALANIPLMPNRVRPFPFEAALYKARNAVERFFNNLKHFRAAPPDTTSATTTILLGSKAPQSASGCERMNR